MRISSLRTIAAVAACCCASAVRADDELSLADDPAELKVESQGAGKGRERKISVAEFRDRMAGAWIGQSVGVTYGAPTEFKAKGRILEDGELPAWSPEAVNGTFSQDDLYVEMTFLRTLETRGTAVTAADAGIDFANSRYHLWCANHNGRNNLRRGIAAPDSGHPNFHPSPDDIDYQIEADFSGILAPGMPGAAIRLGNVFGRIMNYGDGLYAGQFVGGMYAEAYFTADRVKTVKAGLACIPSESQYAEMVRDMLAWYAADPKDWRGTWRKAVDKYQATNYTRCCSWPAIDVKINGAMVLLGYLYGEGDPERTMRIATAGGFDSDCNPSTACGVLFTQIGAKALPAKYAEKLAKDRKWSYTDYTYPELLAVCEKLTRQLVAEAGGRVEKDGAGREWLVVPTRKPKPNAFEPSYRPQRPARARYSATTLAQILYAPCETEGLDSTRVRGKDYLRTPGAVTVTWSAKGGERTDLEGYADIAARRPVTSKDLFWAASNTKGVAAALVLTYVDEGKIGLDDPVEKHFPEWKDIKVNAKEGRRPPKTKPTVRQVLSHMSGLSFFPKMPIDQYSMRELVTIAVARGLDADPGTRYCYSNWGIDVAAAIVEKVSGKPWEKALQERILDPLEMTDTTFWPTEKDLKRLVVPYWFPKNGHRAMRGNGVTQFRPDVTDRTRHAEAGGGLYSTAGDFAKFYSMVAMKGVARNGKRILSEKACTEWYRRQTPPGVRESYSFGMRVNEAAGEIGHGGAYKTDATANWRNGTCEVRFVQMCGRPDYGRGRYEGAAAKVAPKHVVFIAFDGMAGNTLPYAKAPTLFSLMKDGAWTLRSRSMLPSSSSCNWHSIFTCSASEQHGYIAWNSSAPAFAPAAMTEKGLYPDLMYELRRREPKAEIGYFYDWDGMGFTADTNACSVARFLKSWEVTDAAIAYLKEKKPRFLVIYHDSPDDTGHGKGWGSPQYMERLTWADGETKRILAAIDAAGMAADTTVVFSSDHGGIGFGHGGPTVPEMERPVILSGKGVKKGHEFRRPGTVYDTGATLAALLGIEPPTCWIGRPFDEAFGD